MGHEKSCCLSLLVLQQGLLHTESRSILQVFIMSLETKLRSCRQGGPYPAGGNQVTWLVWFYINNLYKYGDFRE
jgi:hypothetical protein